MQTAIFHHVRLFLPATPSISFSSILRYFDQKQLTLHQFYYHKPYKQLLL